MTEKTETVHIERRARITEKQLEQAFETCDDAFWKKAVELFPEATTGDTDPYATGLYIDVSKAFLKHWLSANTDITVGEPLTHQDAVDLIDDELEGHHSSRSVGDRYEIPVGESNRKITLKVVLLSYHDEDHTHAVEITDQEAGRVTRVVTADYLTDAVEEMLTRAADDLE